MEVDYLALSERYASFLVAVGGVSITVLTLVLSMPTEQKVKVEEERAFLIAALIVAAICSFIGAHMMSETAASLTYHRKLVCPEPTGQRLFLLASTNIFLAAFLVLFSLMMLPLASAKTSAGRVTSVSVMVFLTVMFGIILWLWRASVHRMPSQDVENVVIEAFAAAFILWAIIYYLFRKRDPVPLLFVPIVFLTVCSLVYFAWTFENNRLARDNDKFFFAFAVVFSCISLTANGLRIILDDLPGKRKHPAIGKFGG